jgi:phytoene synthase
MPSDEQLATSKSIHRRTGPTFYLATRFLPERVREPTYVLYGFFRIADEVVDAEDRGDPEEQRRELDEIRTAVLGEETPDDDVLAAFAEICDRHGIPDSEVETFLDAMEQDVTVARYETYEEVEAYMRGSAAAVGHMMTAVMDPADHEAAAPHAGALGEAFQLTNFLRDVREDIEDRDRVYLPQETLRAHGVTDEQLRVGDANAAFAAAMQVELARAEELYREGVAGISLLPEDCQFPVLLAAVLYADHHRAIRNRGFDVLSDPPSLTRRRKLSLLARTYYRWRRTKDPEAVFYTVTDVAPPTERTSAEGRRRDPEAGEASPDAA